MNLTSTYPVTSLLGNQKLHLQRDATHNDSDVIQETTPLPYNIGIGGYKHRVRYNGWQTVRLENTTRYLSKLYGTQNIGCTRHYKIAGDEKF